jgi:hypothetical protein
MTLRDGLGPALNADGRVDDVRESGHTRSADGFLSFLCAGRYINVFASESEILLLVLSSRRTIMRKSVSCAGGLKSSSATGTLVAESMVSMTPSLVKISSSAVFCKPQSMKMAAG